MLAKVVHSCSAFRSKADNKCSGRKSDKNRALRRSRWSMVGWSEARLISARTKAALQAAKSGAPYLCQLDHRLGARSAIELREQYAVKGGLDALKIRVRLPDGRL